MVERIRRPGARGLVVDVHSSLVFTGAEVRRDVCDTSHHFHVESSVLQLCCSRTIFWQCLRRTLLDVAEGEGRKGRGGFKNRHRTNPGSFS